MIRIPEPHARVERIARIVKDSNEIPDIHMLIPVCPLLASRRLETWRTQLPNLLGSNWRRLHSKTINCEKPVTPKLANALA